MEGTILKVKGMLPETQGTPPVTKGTPPEIEGHLPGMKGKQREAAAAAAAPVQMGIILNGAKSLALVMKLPQLWQEIPLLLLQQVSLSSFLPARCQIYTRRPIFQSCCPLSQCTTFLPCQHHRWMACGLTHTKAGHALPNPWGVNAYTGSSQKAACTSTGLQS